MDIFSRNRFTVWAIAILIVLNILTISLFWYREYKSQPASRREYKKNSHFRHEMLLKEEVGYSQEQIDHYKKLGKIFFEKTRFHRTAMNELKRQVLDEVFKEHPDIQKADEIAMQIGQTESELSKLFFQHFLQVKSISNPDQQKKMQVLFKDFFRGFAPPNTPDFRRFKPFREKRKPRRRPDNEFPKPLDPPPPDM